MRGQSDLTMPFDREGSVAAHERKPAGTPRAGLQLWVPRRVTAAALARFCAILKVIFAETRADGRGLERTPPIDAGPVNGAARRIDRRSWAKRQVTEVDDDVLVRIREHHRRDKCLASEVVREECTPRL